MPINAMIPMSGARRRRVDPMGEAAQAIGIGNALQQRKMQAQDAERKNALIAETRGAVGPDGSVNWAALEGAHIGAGDAAGAMEIAKGRTAMAKDATVQQLNDLRIGKQRLDMAASAMQSVNDEGSYQSWRNQWGQHFADVPETFDPSLPGQFMRQAMSISEQVSAALDQDKFAETKRHNQVTENLGGRKASAAEKAAGAASGPKPTDIAGMRKEFSGQSKDFIKVRDSYARINETAKEPTAAGDLALIFNFMKMLDPGSVVRESEFATAENAAGVPEQIRSRWNRLKSGERLTPAQRSDFLGQAEKLFSSQLAGHSQLEEQYRGIASRAGYDPSDIVVDYVGKLRSKPETEGGAAEPVAPDAAQIEARAQEIWTQLKEQGLSGPGLNNEIDRQLRAEFGDVIQ